MTAWSFTDPVTGATYAFPRNPKTMTSPHAQHQTDTGFGTPAEPRIRSWRQPQGPHDWSFSGKLTTQTEYDAFLAWVEKPYPVYVNDHFGRSWYVLLTEFNPNEKYPTQRVARKVEYEIKGLITQPEFSPESLTGLQLWLDSNFPAGRLGSRPADGAALTTWSDLSTNGRHLTQASSSLRPVFRSTDRNLLTNPSFREASGTTVVRTNIAINPVVAVGVDAWLTVGADTTGTRQTGQTGWANSVTTSFRTTWTAAKATAEGGMILTYNVPVTAGKFYSSFAQIRCVKQQRLWFEILWYAGGTYLETDGGTTIIAANTVTDFRVTAAQAPATATIAYMKVYAIPGTSSAGWSIGDWLEATWAHLEETDQSLNETASVNGVFHGSLAATTNGADYTYDWTGGVHISASRQRAPAIVGWTAFGGTPLPVVHRSTERSNFGRASARVLWGTAPTLTGGAAGTVTGLVIGEQYTFSAYLWIPTGSPNAGVRVASLVSGTTVLLRDEWVRSSVTFNATATTHTFYGAVNFAATVRGDDVCYVSGAMLETGATASTWVNRIRLGAGKVAVQFDGLDDYMASVSYDMGSPEVTIYMVMQQEKPFVPYAGVFGTNGFAFAGRDINVGSSLLDGWLQTRVDTRPGSHIPGGPGINQVVQIANGFDVAPVVMSLVVDNSWPVSSVRMAVNNGTPAIRSLDVGTVTTWGGISRLGGGTPATIYGLLIYRGVHDTATRNRIERWLGRRYGVLVA